MRLDNLAQNIQTINVTLRDNAAKAINKCVTARNWLIGYYIVNYEQNGEDRATYGDKVLQSLASKLKEDGLSYGNLKLYRQFYNAFPELKVCISRYLHGLSTISQPLVSQLQLRENESNIIRQPLVAQLENDTKITNSEIQDVVAPDKIFSLLSYSHLIQLVNIDDPLERAFYEIEAIKGVWSKRELKRQIDSQLYFRTGISQNKDAVVALANTDAEQTNLNPGDNPPIGILLCSKAGKEMVEYASPGIDENVFVSTYMLQLPSKETLLQWLKNN